MIELRIEAAKRRERAARLALARAYERKRAAIEKATKKHLPAINAAERRCYEARAAVTLAEMAAHGIVPMETIIACKPALEGPHGRYCVRITREGWPRLLAVGVSGKVLAGRAERQSPWRWADARITGEKVKT
jgi:hypothetical protein